MHSPKRGAWRLTFCLALTIALLMPSFAVGNPSFGDRAFKPKPKVAASGFQAAADPPEPNDEIPGVPAGASPIVESLDLSADQHDVYEIAANVGEKITVSLAGPATGDFEVVLFPPTASQVGTDSPVIGALGGAYPREFTYLPKLDGSYYIDVYCADGFGDYSLTWDVVPAAADDEIPGVALPASPVPGTLAEYGDVDDVFALDLAAGETVSFSLSGDAGTDFDLALFDSVASNVYLDTPIAFAATDAYPEVLNYTSATAATYYVAVRQYLGDGGYTLSYTRGVETSLTIDGPPSVVSPNSALLSGVLNAGGVGSVGETITVEAMPDGSASWSPVGTDVTDATGAWSLSVTPSVQTQYRAVFAGTPTLLASMSSAHTVAVTSAARPTTTSIYGPSTVNFNSAGKLTGLLWNYGVGGIPGAPVEIQAMPAGSAVWTTVATVMTDSGGYWYKYVWPQSKTAYRAFYAGSPNALMPATSSILLMTPRASLTKPSVPSKIKEDKSFNVTGYLQPRPGSGVVQIRAYRWSNTKNVYHLQKTYNATLTRFSDWTTKYSAKVTCDRTGKWLFVAYTPASAQNVASTSPGKYITVK